MPHTEVMPPSKCASWQFGAEREDLLRRLNPTYRSARKRVVLGRACRNCGICDTPSLQVKGTTHLRNRKAVYVQTPLILWCA